MLYTANASTPLQYFSVMELSRLQDEEAAAPTSNPSARAYRHTGRQIADYNSSASAVVKPNFFGVACVKQWLIFRITFCFCFQCTICMLFGILQPNGIHITTLVMIALSTFSIIHELDGFVESIIHSITVGISLQRLSEYIRKHKHHSHQEADYPQRDAVARLRVCELLTEGARLQIEGLRCGYVGRKSDVVNGVSTDLAGGSWLGVVGPAGSGKSTLLLGLSRLVEPRAGRVVLGGVDLRDRDSVSPELLRRMVRYVPQEPAIFEGSLRFNVDPAGEHGDARVWQALRFAGLGAVMNKMEDGLDHWISRTGGGLSLGQRQLLCLARAICEEPVLLLLDASLSAVDQRTLDEVWRSLAAGLRKTVVVVATQRAASVRNFDEIIMLNEGTVVEQGPVKELLSNANSSFTRAVRRVQRA